MDTINIIEKLNKYSSEVNTDNIIICGFCNYSVSINEAIKIANANIKFYEFIKFIIEIPHGVLTKLYEEYKEKYININFNSFMASIENYITYSITDYEISPIYEIITYIRIKLKLNELLDICEKYNSVSGETFLIFSNSKDQEFRFDFENLSNFLSRESNYSLLLYIYMLINGEIDCAVLCKNDMHKKTDTCIYQYESFEIMHTITINDDFLGRKNCDKLILNYEDKNLDVIHFDFDFDNGDNEKKIPLTLFKVEKIFDDFFNP
jgi:hypothetical protein